MVVVWTRKELKTDAKGVIKRNYWSIVAVSFILSIFVGTYTNWGWMFSNNDDIDAQPNYAEDYDDAKSNRDVFDDFINNLTEKRAEEKETENAIQEAVEDAINDKVFNGSVDKSLFARILHSINGVLENNYTVMLLSLSGFLIGCAFIFLFCNVLEVGGKRFFLETRKYEDTQIRRIFYGFINGRLKNVVWTQFCRSVFLGLWWLTIVGGIIKSYEYIMIPYILAENPHIERKQAFALSKQMMRGNKWKTFVLQISFFWWYMLSAITLGILDIFYVTPYVNTTMAELYMKLREQAIEDRYEYCEALNDRCL